MALRNSLVLRQRLILLVILLALLVPLAAGAAPWATDSETEIYVRVEPIETVAGVVELTRESSLLVTVPARCEGGEARTFECRETRRFSTLVGVRMAEERVAVDGGLFQRDRSARGAIFLAADLEPDAEADFEKSLRRAFEERSAMAFAEPLSGLVPGAPPFDRATIGTVSPAPTWLCYKLQDKDLAVLIESELAPAEPGETRSRRQGLRPSAPWTPRLPWSGSR